jgi:hypothetical protein
MSLQLKTALILVITILENKLDKVHTLWWKNASIDHLGNVSQLNNMTDANLLTNNGENKS